MSEGNGTPVTWREFNLVLEGIKDIKSDVRDLQSDVKTLLHADATDEGRESATRDVGARVWARLAFAAAVLGDIATVVWLTHG